MSQEDDPPPTREGDDPRTRRRARTRSRRRETTRPDEPPKAAAPREPRAVTASHHAAPFDEGLIDPDVLKVVRRLRQEGHDAYLVGGCVRDLLLDRTPKDFDVATSARPEAARRVFKNSRVIGRRFRLVHVMFRNQKVIEVATFRRTPELDEARADQPIKDDNAYGTIEEDAIRRDFTMNALFYDPDEHAILDFCDGMPDVERRAVRTIGDPFVRFREDPVRMLRAVKFAAKLDLGIDPDVVDAILFERDRLRLSAKPRVFEEILRLLRGGAARRGVFLAWELGLVHVLLPELAHVLDDVDEAEDAAHTRVFRLLAEIDTETAARGEALDDLELFALLLLEPALEACEGERDRQGALVDFTEPVLRRLSVPRRIADGMRRIIALLPAIESGRGKRVGGEIGALADNVARLRALARGDTKLVKRLATRARAEAEPQR